MNKFIKIVLIFGLISLQTYLSAQESFVYKVYSVFDTNTALLQKADKYLSQVQTFQDLLPSATWQGTLEDYVTSYVETDLKLQLSDIFLGKTDGYDTLKKIIDSRVAKSKEYIQAARQCVQYRAIFFKSMSDKLSEIEDLQVVLLQVYEYLELYKKFLLGHQIINFYQDLPSGDSLSDKVYEEKFLSWIYKGYYKDVLYIFVRNAQQLLLDLNLLNRWLDDENNQYYKDFPILYEQIKICQQKISCAINRLVNYNFYKKQLYEYKLEQEESLLQLYKDQFEYYQKEALNYRKQAQIFPNQRDYYTSQAESAYENMQSYFKKYQKSLQAKIEILEKG